jgi:hypothetical protein
MKYIEYLDLPNIPEHLLEPIQDIINKPPKGSSDIPESYPYFKKRNVNTELHKWLQSIFDFKIDPQYQLVYDGLPIHIDKGNRIYAYNYLLVTGGNDVKTVIYDEHLNPLQSEKIISKRWHRINTGMLHGVHGIPSNNVRVAVSIGYTKII